MTAFVELPLVSDHAQRTVWLNPAQVGSVESGMPSKPDSCWVTMVWGCRHQIALAQWETVEALAERALTLEIDLRDRVRENLNRGKPCAGDPCTCTNGIGCVNVPVEEW